MLFPITPDRGWSSAAGVKCSGEATPLGNSPAHVWTSCFFSSVRSLQVFSQLNSFMVNNEQVRKCGCAKVHDLIGQIVSELVLGGFSTQNVRVCVCVLRCVLWCLQLKGPFAEQTAVVMPPWSGSRERERGAAHMYTYSSRLHLYMPSTT